MRSFNETLLALLRATGTSNTALANGCDIKRPTINAWLKGSDPSFKNVVAVCNFFHVTPNEMAGFDEIDDDRLRGIVEYRNSVSPNSKRVEYTAIDLADDENAEFDELVSKARKELELKNSK